MLYSSAFCTVDTPQIGSIIGAIIFEPWIPKNQNRPTKSTIKNIPAGCVVAVCNGATISSSSKKLT